MFFDVAHGLSVNDVGARMTTEARRSRLLDTLESVREPVSGSQLSAQLGVSRQAIVQDIAILRSGGAAILATSRGYVLASHLGPAVYRTQVAVQHSADQTRDELLTLVNLGITVVDVAVEHSVYGKLRGELRISSFVQVNEFLERIASGRSHLLSELTEGRHTHTLEASTELLLERARDELQRLGFLLPVTEPEPYTQSAGTQARGR